MARNTKAGLIKAMGDYYTAESKTGADALFKGVAYVQSAWKAYSEDQKIKAEKKFGTLDVMPSGLQAWNDQSKEVFMPDLQALADRYEVAKKNNDQLEAMKIQKEYGELVGTINKLSTMFTNAKADTFGKDGNPNYSRATETAYINQMINGNYTLKKGKDNQYLITTFTKGDDDTIETFDGTLDDFDAALFLRADAYGENVNKAMSNISKNSTTYEGGKLDILVNGIASNAELLMSSFWDPIYELSSGGVQTTTGAIWEHFARSKGYDETKMEEYKFHTPEYRGLTEEEKNKRYSEMFNFVSSTLKTVSKTRWQRNRKTDTKTPLGTIQFESGTIQLLDEKYKDVTIGGIKISPIEANNILRMVESKQAFDLGGFHYEFRDDKWYGFIMPSKGINYDKPQKYFNDKNKLSETGVLDKIGFGNYLRSGNFNTLGEKNDE